MKSGRSILVCPRCGYEVGRADAEYCAECGLPRPPDGEPWVDSIAMEDPAWARALTRNVRMMRWGLRSLFLSIITLLIITCLGIAFGVGPGTPDGWMEVVLEYVVGILGVGCCISVAITAVTMILLTRRSPNANRAGLTGPFGWAAIMSFGVMYLLTGYGPPAPATQILFSGLLVVAMGVVFWHGRLVLDHASALWRLHGQTPDAAWQAKWTKRWILLGAFILITIAMKWWDTGWLFNSDNASVALALCGIVWLMNLTKYARLARLDGARRSSPDDHEAPDLTR